MDSHSAHMNLELEGAEREKEARAIAAQRAADLDHLLKNTHPSMRDSVSLGDASNGTNQALSDYSAQIFTIEIDLLKEANAALRDSIVCLSSELTQLKTDLQTLRSQVVRDWTPETPAEEEQPPAPSPVIEMPKPAEPAAPAPEAPVTTEASKVQQ